MVYTIHTIKRWFHVQVKYVIVAILQSRCVESWIVRCVLKRIQEELFVLQVVTVLQKETALGLMYEIKMFECLTLDLSPVISSNPVTFSAVCLSRASLAWNSGDPGVELMVRSFTVDVSRGFGNTRLKSGDTNKHYWLLSIVKIRKW